MPRWVCGELSDSKVRALHFFTDEDGSLVIRGRLPAEPGTVFVKAVDAVVLQQDSEAAAARTREMMPVATDWSAQASCFGRPAALVRGDRRQIVVHVDAATLNQSRHGRRPQPLQRHSASQQGVAGDPVRTAFNRIQPGADRQAA